MKTNTVFLLICCIINIKCTLQHNTQEQRNNSTIYKKYSQIEKIELREQTRGTNRLITFTKDAVTTSLNGNTSTSQITAADWESISKQAGLLDLTKISTYESPTTKRFSDGALASSITVTANGNTYNSAGFDAGIPPKELEGLYILLKGKSKSIIKIPRTR
ncbi:hypothetical protein [Chryseobacterium sp. EO14]|uniref:hypothetical protein n=1 Tax=Chryseobacterium sp. EO14 TaxID=2950551 RepID=UPI00210D62C7|nr:hypothetical protein [Chryseobacterium sp. EO14]MCQ4141713.1 hypothetical protein [Chryseobacterium sp. EO14]